MNKEKYEKLSSYDKIDYDIAMKLYFKHNDKIATINDHLGEMYGYSDLKDAEDLMKKEELDLYKHALKDKCNAIDKAIEYIENNKLYHYDYDDEELFEIVVSNKKELLEILKGSDDLSK